MKKKLLESERSYPSLQALQEQLAETARERANEPISRNIMNQYVSDFMSSLGTNIGSPIGDLPRIELFARKEDYLFETKDWEGWDVWGDEVESDIELLSKEVKDET